jgi:hypothetical protein
VPGECQGKGLFGSTYPTNKHLGAMTANLLAQGIRTFVIGFGGGYTPGALNAIAAAGGTPFTEFLVASDTKSLKAAFAQIASNVVSCVFELDPEDPTKVDLDEVNFKFDGADVPYDQTCSSSEAWRWVDVNKKTTVEFCPGACEKLQNGDVKEVGATFGCPTVIPK